MVHIPDSKPSDNEVPIVAETVRILKNRHRFNEVAFRKYLKDAGWFVAIPDEVTPEWVHRVAESLAGEFTRWQAGGRQ